MNTMTRRDFFLGTFSKAETKTECIVGRISDFPIGKSKSLTALQVEIESLPEGLRARSLENERCFYSIKMNQIGELIVNRRELWPENQAFSILTNEQTSLEDRS
ncbi:MAG TPA: hypothetical protein VIG33_06950 [Pseudobdellovibrionaceae bacterium]|jgi:hypothetical protein